MSETVGESPSATTTGPVAIRQRALAPDLARGTMLLIVAVVHAHMFLMGSTSILRGYPDSGSTLDSIAAAALTMFADGRSYPMFSALFGYGMVQILRRQERLGRTWPAARKLLRRRGWWLLLFGLVHVFLLFSGDILGTYGIIAVLFVATLRSKDSRLLTYAGIWFVAGSAVYALSLYLAVVSGAEAGSALYFGDDVVSDAVFRLAFWPFNTLIFMITSMFPFLIGVWAARRRVLEEPERHLRLLRRTATIGITITALGGLPLALITSRLIPESELPGGLTFGISVLHTATGYAGGFGYAALVALVAHRIAARKGPFTTALAACGQRSMTSYIGQSVAWLVLFAPYTLNLGATIGVAASLGIGVATWLTTVIIAEVLRRADARGPAEFLLRRLTYRTSPST